MITERNRKQKRNILSQGQNRLLQESLKQLPGQGLVQSYPEITEREQKALFLKEALNPIVLQSEWLA